MYKRIVSLAPSNTEIIYALGAEDKLVACTRYCDYPEAAKSKPRIGGWLDINDKLVKSFNPDLVLTSTFVQDKITERYKKLGMNIVALMPKTLEGVYESILEIGKLVDKEDKAKEIVKDMKDKINEIKNKEFKVDKKRLYIEEWHKPPTVSGNWIPDLVSDFFDYSLINSGVYSREVTNEEIQKFDPEIIVVSICGLAKNAKREWIKERVGWENLNAVKNDQVFVFDDSLLNRPGPRLVLGLSELLRR